MAFKKKANRKTSREDVKVVVVVPPDGGYSWVIVAASFYSNFIVDGSFYSFSVYLSAFEVFFNLSPIEVTFIGSVFQASYYFSGPFSCAFVNKFGFRLTSLIGSILLASGILATSLVTNYVGILLLYGVIAGVGAGFCFTASIIVVNYHFETYRALATGLATTGSSIGSVCLAMALELVLSQFGILYALRVQSALAASTLLCGLIYLAPEGTDLIIEGEAASIYDSALLLGINVDDDDTDLRKLLRSSIGIHSNSLHSAISNTSFHYRYLEMLRNHPTPEPGWRKLFYRVFSPKRRKMVKRKTVTTRPLDRPDILFRGSLINIENKQKKEIRTQEHSMLNAFINPELFKSIPFICVLMCMVTFTMALATPYMFLVDRAINHHIPYSTAKWILPTISVGNTFGRIACGLVSFAPKINVAYLVGTTSAFAGGFLIISAFIGTDNVVYQFVLAFSLGFLFAFSPTLRTMCYVRYIGMKLLTSAFGFGLLCAGLAALSGTPIAGLLKSATGTYSMSFVFSGLNVLASSVFAFAAEYVYRRSIK